MENKNYTEIKEHLKGILKTAKKLGLQVQPGGGYAMGYDINNLPPYAVGLFGALSIVEGQGARCKIGLTFNETQTLESGFNGDRPIASKRDKKNNIQYNEELFRVGKELRNVCIRLPIPSSSLTFADGLFYAPKKKASPLIKTVSMGAAIPQDKLKKLAPDLAVKDKAALDEILKNFEVVAAGPQIPKNFISPGPVSEPVYDYDDYDAPALDDEEE